MKIAKFSEIFSGTELHPVLLGGEPTRAKIKKKEAVCNLLIAQNPKLEALFVKTVQESSQRKKFCGKLLAKYLDLKPRTSTDFPNHWVALANLHTAAADLKKDNYKAAKALLDTIKERTSNDPTISKDSHYSIKHSQDILKASLVKTEHQNFVLSCCPKTAKAARLYFEECLKFNTTVFVALLESKESSSRANNFWHDKKVHDHPDFGGIIQSATTKVWAEQKARITQTDILFTNGKKVTFFHHEGWKDHFPAPNKKLLAKLVNHTLNLNGSKEAPIAVNCHGGVGRTGLFAIYAYLRRKVESQLAAGKKLDEITINIPEAIHLFRKQRASLLGNQNQVAQLYKLMHEFYLELKS